MSNYALVPISLFFIGKLGKTELAAAGLSISIFHVAGCSITFGLLTASETLFSQVFYAAASLFGSLFALHLDSHTLVIWPN